MCHFEGESTQRLLAEVSICHSKLWEANTFKVSGRQM